ncbi:hypothetical protein ACWERV_31580 [Streptomyces sp. NPDC004031]
MGGCDGWCVGGRDVGGCDGWWVGGQLDVLGCGHPVSGALGQSVSGALG